MYHRIDTPDYDPWWLSVSPANFAEQMRIVKKYARPVRMQEMVKNRNNFSIGKKGIVITFDDGYANNYHNALPILEKHAIPATFYITSGAVNVREEFWWDEIARLTMAVKKLPEVFSMVIAEKKYQWRVNSKEEPRAVQHLPGTYLDKTELLKSQLHYALWEIISPLSLKEKKEILNQIAIWSSQPSIARPGHLPMTSLELESLAKSPLCEIGAHTISHAMLSHFSPNEQEIEIAGSKDSLERIINRPVTSFSYPHGDYSKETEGIVRRLGFTNACTVEARPVNRGENTYLLPRVMVLNWNAYEFEKHLLGWLSNYPDEN